MGYYNIGLIWILASFTVCIVGTLVYDICGKCPCDIPDPEEEPLLRTIAV